MEKKVKAEVLAVDDHCLILEGISKIVNKMPDAIVTNVATSGRAALELIGRHNYDVCILDVSMPDMSGFDLIRRSASRMKMRVSLFIPCMRKSGL